MAGLSVDTDRTLIRIQKAGDNLEQDAFSPARLAQNDQGLTGANVQIHPLQNPVGAEGFVNAANFDHRPTVTGKVRKRR
jgi:hypothetical protein